MADNIERIGAYLRRERELRGMSIEDISRQTRIQRVHLEAIERDDFVALPPGPFVTGFVGAYARALGLKVDPVLAMLPEIEEPPVDASPTLLPDVSRGEDLGLAEIPVGDRGPGGVGWVLIVTLLLGAAAVAAFVFGGPFIKQLRMPDLRLPSLWGSSVAEVSTDVGGEAVVGNAPGSTAPSAGAGTGEKSPAAASSGSSSANSSAPIAATGAQSGASAGSGVEGESRAGTSGGETSGTAEGSSLDLGPIQKLAPVEAETDHQTYQVYQDSVHKPGDPQVTRISAQAKSYLRVSTRLDGTPIFEGVLGAGESKEFSTSQEDLWIVLGNAGGVEVSLNGRVLPVQGRYGQRVGVGLRRPGGE